MLAFLKQLPSTRREQREANLKIGAVLSWMKSISYLSSRASKSTTLSCISKAASTSTKRKRSQISNVVKSYNKKKPMFHVSLRKSKAATLASVLEAAFKFARRKTELTTRSKQLLIKKSPLSNLSLRSCESNQVLLRFLEHLLSTREEKQG